MSKKKEIDRKYLDLLFTMAQDQDPVGRGRWRVTAALVIKKSLVIFGSNASKTDPMTLRYGRKPEAPWIHAETAAIKKAINHFRGDASAIRGATLYVMRSKIDKPGGVATWGNSKPCSGCSSAIWDHGISRVVYSLDGIGNFNVI